MRRLPAEWETQEAIWLSWPPFEKHWGGKKEDLLQKKWAEIASLISQSQVVRINASLKSHVRISQALAKSSAELTNIELYDHCNDDVWCRDHGAIFVEEDKELVATDWKFNGWGEHFAPYGLDDKMASQMAQSQGIRHERYEEVLEGGAIETNGAGTLLTTEAVLLNPNRNPHLNQAGVEKMLQKRLGVKGIIWLNEGIEGDDTGGHIDDIARFTNENTILISSSQEGRNKETLEENLRRLEETRFTTIKLPMPEPCEVPGWRLPILPASYVNFLITNELVLVPTFQQKANDDYAIGVIQEQFPRRTVIGVDCLDIVQEGGALHCLSMQQPALKKSKL